MAGASLVTCQGGALCLWTLGAKIERMVPQKEAVVSLAVTSSACAQLVLSLSFFWTLFKIVLRYRSAVRVWQWATTLVLLQ